MGLPERQEVSIEISAPQEKVYDLVSDVTRMGEWSPECARCEWTGEAVGPAVGARFKGHNKRGLMRWSNTPTVTAADPGKVFAFSRTAPGAGEVVWRYEMAPSDGGTTLTESYEIVRPANPVMGLMTRVMLPGDRGKHLNEDMQVTLRCIKGAAEGAAG